MKRVDGDTPRRAREGSSRRSRHGLTVVAGSADSRWVRHARHDPMAEAMAEIALIEDFLEFLEDDDDADPAVGSLDLPIPSPLFRERLRRRLWGSLGFARMLTPHDVH